MSQNRNGDQDPIPVVSVIAPVYNGCATIGDCIESLLEQDYPADCYEVIVVDNNSTDGTPDVVAKYPELTPLDWTLFGRFLVHFSE